MVVMNATCIENALTYDERQLEAKQQVGHTWERRADHGQIYFKYLLWATFGLSAVRFIGVSPPYSVALRQSNTDRAGIILLGNASDGQMLPTQLILEYSLACVACCTSRGEGTPIYTTKGSKMKSQ